MYTPVIDMVREWLVANGYDGLANEAGECGCGIDGLAPCCNVFTNCVAAYEGNCQSIRLWFPNKGDVQHFSSTGEIPNEMGNYK